MREQPPGHTSNVHLPPHPTLSPKGPQRGEGERRNAWVRCLETSWVHAIQTAAANPAVPSEKMWGGAVCTTSPQRGEVGAPPRAPGEGATARELRRRLGGGAHLGSGSMHRLDDVLVAGAAAQVGGEHVQKLLVADVGLVLQHVGGEHQEAGRAEPALQPMMLHEGALQRMQV